MTLPHPLNPMTRHLLIPALALSGAAGLCAADPAGTVSSFAAAGPPASSALAEPATLRASSSRIEAELRQDILPFWMQHVPDRAHGGFVGEISNDLVVRKDAPRGGLLTARILWTFSAAYQRYHDPAYLEMARWARDDLVGRFWDERDGGLYWTVTPDGAPLDTRKEIYLQAFGILGLSEYYRATGDPAALQQATTLYHAIETHARDHTHGGYFEEFSREWKLQTDVGVHRSLMGSQALKSQNVHLHILEAYTNLLRVWPDASFRQTLRELAEVMLTRVYDSRSHHLRLFLDPDWTPRSQSISYGHDIEFSWLACEAANELHDPDLIARSKAMAVEVVRTTLAEGVDADGGIFNEGGPAGLTDRSKDWWPQAEAMVGFLNAYQLGGDPEFLRASLHTWDFIEARLVDRENGEWFRGVTKDGRHSSDPKVSLWKCPYHNGRACMEMVNRINAVLTRSRPAAEAAAAPRN